MLRRQERESRARVERGPQWTYRVSWTFSLDIVGILWVFPLVYFSPLVSSVTEQTYEVDLEPRLRG